MKSSDAAELGETNVSRSPRISDFLSVSSSLTALTCASFVSDSSFDFSFEGPNAAKMIGDLPGDSASPESDAHSDSPDYENSDKRSHPDDDDDDEHSGGAKRRESEEKVPKKPGRKPLTTEPSSVSLRRQMHSFDQHLF